MQVLLNLEPTGSCRVRDAEHFDLRANPKAMERIDAAQEHPPLRALLAHLNGGDSLFSTFASRVWEESDDSAAEPFLCASRLDLIFLREDANFGIGPYRALAERLGDLLGKEAGGAVSAQLKVCKAAFSGEDGYCLRIVIEARGTTAEQSQLRWGFGLARLQQALLFATRELRQVASLN